MELGGARWKPRYAGGLLTDGMRTLVSHTISASPDRSDLWEAQVPPLSLATFVWTETMPGSLTLPKTIPMR